VADELVERLRAKIEKQRTERGDYLDYGSPDPELVDALTRIEQDAARIRERDQRIELLEKAAKKAADIFAHYAELHAAKGTLDGQKKAERNAGYAIELYALLSDQKEQG